MGTLIVNIYRAKMWIEFDVMAKHDMYLNDLKPYQIIHLLTSKTQKI